MSEIHQEWFTTFDPLQIELRETRQVGVQAFQVATIERIVPVLVWSLPVFGMPGAALMFRNPDTLTSPRRAFRSPNGGFYMTSSVTWDYLRFWRQLLLVRHCDWTDEFLFQNVMELVCTRKHGTFTDRSGGDFDRLLSSIRGGYRTIEQVMSLSVPDWLVDRMLAMWRTPGIVPVPQVLVRELQAGTLPWAYSPWCRRLKRSASGNRSVRCSSRLFLGYALPLVVRVSWQTYAIRSCVWSRLRS